ncbi:MAG: hypothetical protein WBN07_13290 [Woeseiaceae bacterium]
MIVRRLAGSLRKLDWSLLLVEMAVLAIGVLLGLRVDAWNESRQDRVDEREFLIQLHGELEAAFDLYATNIRSTKERMENMLRAVDMLARQDDADTLSEEECRAIGASAFLVPHTFQLTSLEELFATGRFAIIRSAELRFALIKVQQLSEKTDNTLVNLALTPSILLSGKYPDAIQVQSNWNNQDNEVRLRWHCDLPAMLQSQGFLNDFAINVDAYDALYRSSTEAEWNHLQAIHQLLDRLLEIDHATTR